MRTVGRRQGLVVMLVCSLAIGLFPVRVQALGQDGGDVSDPAVAEELWSATGEESAVDEFSDVDVFAIEELEQGDGPAVDETQEPQTDTVDVVFSESTEDVQPAGDSTDSDDIQEIDRPAEAEKSRLVRSNSTAQTGTFDNGFTYVYENRTLTISGTGEMTSPCNFKSSWYVDRLILEEGITTICDEGLGSSIIRERIQGTVSLPSTLTYIGKNAFASSRITAITIPGSVAMIGERAFDYCKRLSSVTIESGVTTIGDYAFYMSGDQMRVLLGEGVTTIGDHAFYMCSIAGELTLPSTVQTIGKDAFACNQTMTALTIRGRSLISISEGAFRDCKALQTVTINGGNKATIGKSSFAACKALERVSVGTGVAGIGESAFYGDSSLRMVSLSDDVTSIAGGAFYGCKSMESFAMPSLLTSIGARAFKECASLTNLKLPASLESIGDEAFSGCADIFGAELVIPASVKTIGDSAFRAGSDVGSISSVKTLEFLGNAPSIGLYAFTGFTCKAIYPASDESYTDNVRADTTHSGEFTWYSRNADGSLTKDSYANSYTKVALDTSGKTMTKYLEPLGHTTGGDSSCSFEITLAKKSRALLSLRYTMDDSCTHQSFIVSIKDNEGNELWSSVATKSATNGADLTLPAGKAHVEVIYMDSHNHNGSWVSASCLVISNTSVAKASVSKIAAMKYTGKAIKPVPTVKISGVTLRYGTDYTLTYQNNKKVGKAVIVIKGKGDFTGTKKVTFTIARSVTVKKQAYTSKVKLINKKAATVKKGTTFVTFKGDEGYLKFKVPKKATYTFTFSGLSRVKDNMYGVFGSVYMEAAKRSFYVRTQGGKVHPTAGYGRPLGLASKDWADTSGKMLERNLASRYAKVKLKKGEVVYIYVYTTSIDDGAKLTLSIS